MAAHRLTRTLGPLAAGVLLAGLTACGGEPSYDDYCSRLQEDREQVGEIVASGDPAELLGNLDVLDELRREAPRDLRDEWDTLLTALEGLRDALRDADVKASDFEDGKAPEGLSQADQEAIATAADRVRADDVVAAASGIETQARDVCKINIGL